MGLSQASWGYSLTISHDMASVCRIADQVAMIHKGRVIGLAHQHKCLTAALLKLINLFMAMHKAH